MNIQELEPLVEVTHLRRLLDTQPSCLMRLGADGTVLAANDAALKLIGVTSVAQVLGRDFSAWVPSDQRDRWTAFTTGVVQGYPASVECEIEAPSGDRHPTLFHGVPLTDHPDGVASMAIAARAVSGQRQLEAAVIELEEQLRERDAERFKARARLAESESRQRELAEKLGETEAARAAAETKAAQALTDVKQLEVALEGFAARQKRVAAERAEERLRLAEMTEAAASRREQEQNAVQDLQERHRMAARLQEREATVRALEAAWTEKLAELEAAQNVRQGLEASLLEAQQALAGEQERGLACRAEHEALQSRLGEALAALQERETSFCQLEASHASIADAHASLTMEHERLVRSLRQQAVRLEALANGFRASGAAADADGASGDAGSGGEEGLA